MVLVHEYNEKYVDDIVPDTIELSSLMRETYLSRPLIGTLVNSIFFLSIPSYCLRTCNTGESYWPIEIETDCFPER